MSARGQVANITILDKAYTVSCSEQEREQLYAAVEFVDMKMQKLKAQGKIIGTERIAVITALNIAHELLIYKNDKLHYTEETDQTIQRLYGKIDDLLKKAV